MKPIYPVCPDVFFSTVKQRRMELPDPVLAHPKARHRSGIPHQRRVQSSRARMLPFDATLEEMFANNPYYSVQVQGASGAKYASLSIQQIPLSQGEVDNPMMVFGPGADTDTGECIHLSARQPSFASIGRLVLKGGTSLLKDGPSVSSFPNIVLPLCV